jgi:hypothetical protein
MQLDEKVGGALTFYAPRFKSRILYIVAVILSSALLCAVSGGTNARPLGTPPEVMKDCEAWLARIGARGKITNRIWRTAEHVIVNGMPLLTVKYPAGTRTLVVYSDHEYRAYCEDAPVGPAKGVSIRVRTIRTPAPGPTPQPDPSDRSFR